MIIWRLAYENLYEYCYKILKICNDHFNVLKIANMVTVRNFVVVARQFNVVGI